MCRKSGFTKFQILKSLCPKINFISKLINTMELKGLEISGFGIWVLIRPKKCTKKVFGK